MIGRGLTWMYSASGGMLLLRAVLSVLILHCVGTFYYQMYFYEAVGVVGDGVRHSLQRALRHGDVGSAGGSLRSSRWIVHASLDVHVSAPGRDDDDMSALRPLSVSMS